MLAIPATSWFTQINFANASSPKHPQAHLAVNNDYKQQLLSDWIAQTVKGKRVLDLFSANGGFSFLAAQGGAREVVGVEFSEERVSCANFVAKTLKLECRLEFRVGDVYKINEYFNEPFDVVLCLGGLYHIADPPHLLRQIRALTKEILILQTSSLLPLPGNWARFVVRRDRTEKGLTSIRGGEGVWRYTRDCMHQMIRHGHFRVISERRPPFHKRRRFAWYLALCAPI